MFADGTQSIYLADMSGDGLTDLVRVRNGEVCYWPNLGYGRFGAKVDDGPRPAGSTPDQFDPRRVRLADIDGSGTTDIIYLAPRRRPPLLQPVGQQLERAHAAATFPARRRPVVGRRSSICSATARPAWSGRRRCPATRAGRCATSI